MKQSQAIRRNFPPGSQIKNKDKNEPTPLQRKQNERRLRIEAHQAER